MGPCGLLFHKPPFTVPELFKPRSTVEPLSGFDCIKGNKLHVLAHKNSRHQAPFKSKDATTPHWRKVTQQPVGGAKKSLFAVKTCELFQHLPKTAGRGQSEHTRKV